MQQRNSLYTLTNLGNCHGRFPKLFLHFMDYMINWSLTSGVSEVISRVNQKKIFRNLCAVDSNGIQYVLCLVPLADTTLEHPSCFMFLVRCHSDGSMPRIFTWLVARLKTVCLPLPRTIGILPSANSDLPLILSIWHWNMPSPTLWSSCRSIKKRPTLLSQKTWTWLD